MRTAVPDGLDEARPVETHVLGEGRAHEAGEVDRAEAAAAVVGDRDLAAGIGRLDPLAVMQVVLGVDAVEKQHAGLGGLVGVAHDRAPQVPRPDRRVDPEPVLAPMRAGGDLCLRRLGCVHQLERPVRLDRLHQRIGHADRDVEVVEPPGLALGADELHDVGVVAAQHAHLRAAPGARALDRGAGLVEDMHVADRPRGRAVGAAHPRAARPDRREVVADAAAAAHRLGRLAEGYVDAGLAIDRVGDRIAHRLHEAVDQRDLGDARARRRVDPPAGDEALLERLEKHRLPARRIVLAGGQSPGDARPNRAGHVGSVQIALRSLRVFLAQHVEADLLPRQVDRGVEGARIGLVHGRPSWTERGVKDRLGPGRGQSARTARNRVTRPKSSLSCG
jgi:hypothetical protein